MDYAYWAHDSYLTAIVVGSVCISSNNNNNNKNAVKNHFDHFDNWRRHTKKTRTLDFDSVFSSISKESSI